MATNSAVNDELAKLFSEFDKVRVRYCLLRNYEFLLGKEQYKQDLDIVLASEDKDKVEDILKRYSYRYAATLFHEKKYTKFLPSGELVRLHFHYDFLHYHKIPFLQAKPLLARRRKLKNFYVPSDEDLVIELTLHSIFKKRFKPKYKKIVENLLEKKLDFDYLASNLGYALELLRKRDYASLIATRRRYFFSQKRKLPRAIASRAKHYWLAKTMRLAKPKVISFVGPDGSGKTTLIKELAKVLDKNEQNYEIVYMGRWRNKSAVRKLASSSNRYASDTSRSFIKQFFWVLDLYGRYLKYRFAKKKLIITDRSAYDLLALEKLYFLFSLAIKLFPKPDLVFFLYAPPEELARRKGEDVDKLRRKTASLHSVLKSVKTNVEKVKTNDLKKNKLEIIVLSHQYLL